MSTSATLPSSEGTAQRPPRSLAPDLARGLMLLFIALANVSWYLWGQPASGQSPHPPSEGLLDRILQFLMLIAVDGRTYPLFALLFGYGMVQFYRSRVDRGMQPATVRVMLRRRHWAMLLLGALHAALLFMGDVLGAYGLAALLLVWIFFGRRDRTLVIWESIVIGLFLVMSVFAIIGGLLTLGAPAEAIEEMNAQAAAFSAADTRDLGHGQGAYLWSMLTRLGIWVVLTLGQVVQLVIAMAIVIGWLAARHRLLDEPWKHRTLLRRTAVIGIAIGWLGGLPVALQQVGVLGLPVGLFWMFIGLTAISGLACGVGYAALFGLIALRLEHRETAGTASAGTVAERSAKATTPSERAYGVPAGPLPPVTAPPPLLARGIAAVGARSLSFYLWQSLLFAPLLSAWGLGLGQHLGTAGALLLAAAVWASSVPLAMLLERRGMRGPAELLLRRLTYGKHDRIR